MTKKSLLIILVACIFTTVVYGQDRTSEYEEFMSNTSNMAIHFLILDQIQEDELFRNKMDSLSDEMEKRKLSNTWISSRNEKTMENLKNIVLHAKSNFDKAKSESRFQYKNKYLLEDISNTNFPISSLLEKLNVREHSIDELTPKGQYIYAMSYLLLSLKFLDTTDNYNFTTLIILRKASRELHQLEEYYRSSQ